MNNERVVALNINFLVLFGGELRSVVWPIAENLLRTTCDNRGERHSFIIAEIL